LAEIPAQIFDVVGRDRRGDLLQSHAGEALFGPGEMRE